MHPLLFQPRATTSRVAARRAVCGAGLVSAVSPRDEAPHAPLRGWGDALVIERAAREAVVQRRLRAIESRNGPTVL